MAERIYILRAWVRLWHWINAVLIITLIVSGFSLHYSGTNLAILKFALARQVHNFCGVTLCINYAFFFTGNILSGHWWQYLPRGEGFAERMWLQFRFYSWGIFKGEPHPFPTTPEDNYNPLQQITYWALMYILMPLLMVTGLIYLYPTVAPDHWFGVDGLLPIAVTHYVVGFMIFLYLLLHLYLCTTGKKITTLIMMMITGWHEEDD